MVGAVLREVIELLAVLVHIARTLLQVQEHLKLASHQAQIGGHRKLYGTKPTAHGGRPE
jgi:hypothetical protein